MDSASCGQQSRASGVKPQLDRRTPSHGVKRKIARCWKWGLQFFGKIVRFRVLMQKLVIGLDVGGLRVAAYGRRTGDG